MNDLIPLQTAFIQQRKKYKDNSWIVFDTDNNELFALDGDLEPKEAMSYLHFARPFELKALQTGIEFGKKEAARLYESQLTNARLQMEAIAGENERLAMKLMQFIEGDSV